MTIDILSQEHIVQVDLTIYSLTNSKTIDSPDYIYQSNEQLVLSREAFQSYTQLHAAIQAASEASYLRQQFFRIALAENFREQEFLHQEELPNLDFSQTIHLALVRYSKHQTAQLRPRLSGEELQLLEQVQRFKKIVIQPPRKLPKYLKKSTQIISTCPFTVVDALARVRRVISGNEAVLWKTAQYHWAGLITIKEIQMMDERGLQEYIYSGGDTKGEELIAVDVPEKYVAKIQQYIGSLYEE
ncbi:hypothetical protein SS50377_23496 [Spironucleus salmonicida]|uniref:Uncharacterized protein n=1 Tax=Spironucleus salmonicida TaxID=348837 RepID=V6LZH7_9EUKA|nr:hypothetical protein SS50377_23496 [Spironucleus salmonicida]|eukprot:EST46234.1 hypothetical protein SS50377_13830 [Spironucleus salmonicida]